MAKPGAVPSLCPVGCSLPSGGSPPNIAGTSAVSDALLWGQVYSPTDTVERDQSEDVLKHKNGAFQVQY